jgi:hypothetical protein
MRIVLLIVCALLLDPSTLSAQVFRGYNEDGDGQAKEQAEKKRREVKGFYEGGALHYVVKYERGKLDGDAREYYENGTLKAEVKYQNGRKDGVARYYYPSGMLMARILYNRDKEAGGKSKYYDEKGTLTREKSVSRKASAVFDTLAAASPAPDSSLDAPQSDSGNAR